MFLLIDSYDKLLIAIVIDANDLFVFFCVDIGENDDYKKTIIEKFLRTNGILVDASHVQLDSIALAREGFSNAIYDILKYGVFVYKMTFDDLRSLLKLG